MPIEQYRLPPGWHWDQIANVAMINPPRPPLARADAAATTFVPMAAVSERGKGITAAELRPFGEIKKGYTYFAEGDVLFAKISPCMQNAKHAVARNLIDGIGFGSTEFHVVRPKVHSESGVEPILSEWIHFYLLNPLVIAAAAETFTGAVGQQRVRPEFLHALPIPVPPPLEQRRLVALLVEQMNKVDEAHAAIESQIEATALLRASYLREIFQGEDSQQWPLMPLGQVGQIGSGLTLGRAVQGSHTRSVPYLRVANVKDGYLLLEDVSHVEVTEEEILKYTLEDGDVLFTEGGDPDKLGRGTVWRGELPECLHQNHVFRVRFDQNRLSPDFIALQAASPYGKAYFLAHAKRTTGIASINRTVLGGFPLMVPDIGIQREVVAILAERMLDIQRLRDALEVQRGDLETIFSALLREAFRFG